MRGLKPEWFRSTYYVKFILKEEWEIAINRELDALVENGSFEVVDLPRGCKPLKTNWVLKVKDPNDQKIYKARLVIKGCPKVYKRDYNETFSPVAKYHSIRFLLTCASRRDFDIQQMDVTAHHNAVKTAFI